MLLYSSMAIELSSQSKAVIARELVEGAMRQFGKQGVEEGAEVLTRQEELLVRYGDDVVKAIQKVGPRSIPLLEGAAAEGFEQSARLLAKHGDEAVWVVGNQSRRALAAKLGDEAAEAMIKHTEIAEPILEMAGRSAVAALQSVSTRSGRQIAMLAKDGDLVKIGRTPELMAMIAKFGDRGMDFVWKNKGALLVGTTLATFLANPDPFIDGTSNLASIVAESALAPIAKEIGNQTNWTFTIIALAIAFSAYLLIKSRYKPARRAG